MGHSDSHAVASVLTVLLLADEIHLRTPWASLKAVLGSLLQGFTPLRSRSATRSALPTAWNSAVPNAPGRCVLVLGWQFGKLHFAWQSATQFSSLAVL